MFIIKSKEEFINDVRALHPKFSSLRLNKIEISRQTKTISYKFISAEYIDHELHDLIHDEVKKITPPAFINIFVSIEKIKHDGGVVVNKIVEFLKKEYPSISIFLKEEDVSTSVFGDNVKYVLKLTKDGVEYAKTKGVLNKLNEYLALNFCAEFVGSCEEKEFEETVDLLNEDVFNGEIEKIERRTIKVQDVVVIDDLTIGDVAYYIEDASEGASNVTLCGKITEINERQTKTGKPFFIIRFTDTTGDMSGLYFTRKATYEKIRFLAVDDEIICRGRITEYNGKPSFTIEKINRCTFPKDFVKASKLKTTPAKEYKKIKPQKAELVKNVSFFDDVSLPKELTAQTYAVLDFETTGFEPINNGVTEIGVVKILNGKVVEHFHTLIHAEFPMGIEASEKTGITDEMLKDQPAMEEVFGDLYKFLYGSIIVAHNAEFDTKFLRKYANKFGYLIENKIVDTLAMARETLPQLKHHDLKTLADHFGIVFHHHRALSDAYATADVLTELMKIKYK